MYPLTPVLVSSVGCSISADIHSSLHVTHQGFDRFSRMCQRSCQQ
uniref:Uncharacterized protein n=1 Tax=Anguilla anguilla TaxID=7936 RepID=A0A0E9PC00_ANGAN